MDVVVCDDDAMARSVISELAEGLGHRVLAETDLPSEAVELVDRFNAGLIVLDLALPYGDGLDALKVLHRDHPGCRVVVFSAYAADHGDLAERGAAAIVNKPRFDELEDELRRVGGVDRRRPDSKRGGMAPSAALLSPRGLEPPSRFGLALHSVRTGDIVMVLELDEFEDLSARWGDLGAQDLLLDLAQTVRRTTRVQDRLASPDCRRLHLALLGSGPHGADAVFNRVKKARETMPAAIGLSFSAGHASVHAGESPDDAFLRANRALNVGLKTTNDALWGAGIGGL